MANDPSVIADSRLVTSLSFSRRVMIMVAVVLGTTLYSTTLLVASSMLDVQPDSSSTKRVTPDGMRQVWTCRQR